MDLLVPSLHGKNFHVQQRSCQHFKKQMVAQLSEPKLLRTEKENDDTLNAAWRPEAKSYILEKEC